ncbi:hypothetical protein Hanom_Chr16g01454631 [Helianthus anomalus]
MVADWVIQEDEGFNWDKYIPREHHALVAEVEDDKRWQIDYARLEIDKLYAPFKGEKRAKRWDAERECYLDPQGNPVVDRKKVDFNAVTALFPPCDTFYTRRSSHKILKLFCLNN